MDQVALSKLLSVKIAVLNQELKESSKISSEFQDALPAGSIDAIKRCA
jgi:hypothetical protein